MKGDKWRRGARSGSGFGNQHAGRQMKGDNWRRGFLGICTQGNKWRETYEEAGIFRISIQGQTKGDKWRRVILEPACRETKWRRETRSGSDFGNQHAGKQMEGAKWRRETRSGGDFGDQHAGRHMKGDKWRRETRSGNDFGNQQPNLWEVRTPIASSYLGEWRRETMSGSDFGDQHAGRQMKGDEWRRETRSGSDLGNQQPNLWEVRTPIYLGNEEGKLGAAAISVINTQRDKWRETNEEGRLGAAAISVISNPTFEKYEPL